MKEQMGVNMGVAALGVGVSRVANAIQQLGLYGPWDKIVFGIIMLRLFLTDLSQKPTAMRRTFCPKAGFMDKFK